jgi:hypothetical protein
MENLEKLTEREASFKEVSDFIQRLAEEELKREAKVKKVSDFIQRLTALPIRITGYIGKNDARLTLDFVKESGKPIFGTDLDIYIENGKLGINVGSIGIIHSEYKAFIEMHRLIAVLFDQEKKLVALINSLCD